MPKSKETETVLILAAHPDDEILGCGGAIQWHVAKKDTVFIVIVTDGSSTQYPGNQAIAVKKHRECQKANALLGVKDVQILDFPDMKLDTIPHVSINQKFEEIFEQIKPTIVYTHANTDLNRDHTVVYDATLVVTRPGKKYLKQVLSYEVLSSSEWAHPTPFIPTTFLPLTKTMVINKQKALACYQTEVRPYPHPRSKEAVQILAQYRGLQADCEAAEAFHLIRSYLP